MIASLKTGSSLKSRSVSTSIHHRRAAASTTPGIAASKRAVAQPKTYAQARLSCFPSQRVP